MSSNSKSSDHNINMAPRARNSDSQNDDEDSNQEAERDSYYRNTPPFLLTPTRDLYVSSTRIGSKVTTIQAIDLEGDKLEYSLKPAQYHDASTYFGINSTSGELKLIDRPPPNGTGIYFLNVAANDKHYDSVVEFRVHVSRKDEDDQEQAEKSMMAKTREFVANLYSTDHRPSPINNSSIMLPPIHLNPPLISHEDKRQQMAQHHSPAHPQQAPRRHHPRPRPQTQQQQHHQHTPSILMPLPQSGGATQRQSSASEKAIAASMMPQLAQLDGSTPAQNMVQQQVLFSVSLIQLMIIVSFLTITYLTITLVMRLKRRIKTVERQHERLSKKLSDGSCSLTTNSRLDSATNETDQSMTNYDFDRLNSQSGGGISVYLDQINNGSCATTGRQTDGYANNTFVSNNIYCPVDDEFYSTITTESTLVDNQKIAAHNYNLYTMQRANQQRLPAENHHQNQVSSLIGQIVDSRISTVAGCAQPIRFGDVSSPCESPDLGAGSLRSSTRSLTRFLSMPNRHLSHQSEDTKQAGKSLLEELNLDFFDGKLRTPVPGEDLQAKTIARADRIGREQQVPHKRNRRLPDGTQLAGDSWEIDRDKLEPLNILGQGQFGQVWRYKLNTNQGSIRNGSGELAGELTVAVKTLKKSAAKDARACDELRAEIEIMKMVCNHPNVVRILACCTSEVPNKPILLVMEHVDLGNLQSFLERAYHLYASSASLLNHASSRSLHSACLDPDYRLAAGSVVSAGSTQYDQNYQPMPAKSGVIGGLNGQASDNHHNHLTSRELIKFCYHVAKGMEYIASNCIVHRDLASRNVLINSQHVCKIGDFGMARSTTHMGDVYERRSQNAMVAVRWMAPEALLANTFTTKSDVFSFGILMWEIVTLGETPYRHLETQEIIQAVAVRGERPGRPKHCHELLYEIMSRCWSESAIERPSFKELVKQLDGLLMGTEEYIQLDQFPENKYYNQMMSPLELL